MIIPSHMGPARWSKAEGRYQVDHPGIMGAAGLKTVSFLTRVTRSDSGVPRILLPLTKVGLAQAKQRAAPAMLLDNIPHAILFKKNQPQW